MEVNGTPRRNLNCTTEISTHHSVANLVQYLPLPDYYLGLLFHLCIQVIEVLLLPTVP